MDEPRWQNGLESSSMGHAMDQRATRKEKQERMKGNRGLCGCFTHVISYILYVVVSMKSLAILFSGHTGVIGLDGHKTPG